jgi:hypothetical protein
MSKRSFSPFLPLPPTPAAGGPPLSAYHPSQMRWMRRYCLCGALVRDWEWGFPPPLPPNEPPAVSPPVPPRASTPPAASPPAVSVKLEPPTAVSVKVESPTSPLFPAAAVKREPFERDLGSAGGRGGSLRGCYGSRGSRFFFRSSQLIPRRL